MSCLLCPDSNVTEVVRIPSLPLYLHAVPVEKQAEVPQHPFVAGVCEGCGFIQQLELPAVATMETVYRDFFGTYQSTARTGIGGLRASRFREFLSDHLAPRGRALEIGCFDGHFLTLLAEQGMRVEGCDPSPGAEIAVERGLDVRREFFTRGLYPAAAFDLVVARQLFEHLDDPTLFLVAAAECLAPGGRLALELPDAGLWLGRGVIGSLFHEHVGYYTEEVLRRLLRAAGFEPLEIVTRHTDLFVVAERSIRPRHAITPAAAPARARSISLLRGYEQKMEGNRQALAAAFAETRARGGEVWLYGAGVHSSSLVACMRLEPDHVDHVVDDNPAVLGKVLPNFPHRIRRGADLAHAGPDDLVVVSGYSFQEEMLQRIAGSDLSSRVARLYPEVRILEAAACS